MQPGVLFLSIVLPQTTIVTWLVLTLVFGVPEQKQSMLFHKIGLRTIIGCACRVFLLRVQFKSYVIVMHEAPLLFLNGHPLPFWPLIIPGLGAFAAFVCSVKYFSPAPDLFRPGRGQLIVYRNTRSVFCGTSNSDAHFSRV